MMQGVTAYSRPRDSSKPSVTSSCRLAGPPSGDGSASPRFPPCLAGTQGPPAHPHHPRGMPSFVPELLNHTQRKRHRFGCAGNKGKTGFMPRTALLPQGSQPDAKPLADHQQRAAPGSGGTKQGEAAAEVFGLAVPRRLIFGGDLWVPRSQPAAEAI